MRKSDLVLVIPKKLPVTTITSMLLDGDIMMQPTNGVIGDDYRLLFISFVSDK